MDTHAAGNLDPDFNGNGKVFPAGTTKLLGLAFAVLQTDNEDIFMAGRLGTDYSIVSLKKDGTINTNFNGNGIVNDCFKEGLFSSARDIQQTESNELLISGLYHESNKINHNAFALYRKDGSINTDFGVAGKTIIPAIPGRVYSHIYPTSIPLADGKILVSCTQAEQDMKIGVVYQLHRNGSIDSSFGGGRGFVDIKYLENKTSITAMHLQPDGKILFTGSIHINDKLRSYVARYESDYTIDRNFGDKGFFINPAYSNYDWPYKVKLDSDGKILTVGMGMYEDAIKGVIMRLTSAGQLDPEFNDGNPLVTKLDEAIPGLEFLDVGFQSDKKIIIQGSSVGAEIADVFLVRLLPDGTLDPTFGTGKEQAFGGWVRTKLGPSVDMGYAISVQANDRTVVVGGYSIDGTPEGLRQFALRFQS